jgi:2',3'-cyclic-nucleotide 2'-phosphodiesterase (5'-nucleotidase family)
MVDDDGDDVKWAGTATRVAKDLGVAPRADVKAIVDKANTDTAPLRGRVIGSSTVDLLRDNPDRLRESNMGNMVADAMREKYGVDAAITNSGGLRDDTLRTEFGATPPEQIGELTYGEMFDVLPFGNATVIETLTYNDLVAAFQNGYKPPCGDVAGGTGRTPQISGLKVQFHCNGTAVVIDNIWRTPDGPNGPNTLMGPGETITIVTNDFMYTGGDGYAAFTNGTNVRQTGEQLLDVVIEYVRAHSPVSPTIDHRRIGPYS